MDRLVTAEQMKSYDEYTINVIGVPSMVLMERAALAVVDELKRSEFDMTQVLCIAGAGNNGGDGFAVARLLKLQGIDARVLFIGNREKCSAETAQQFTICENYDFTIYDNDLTVDYKPATVVDALFGIGLTRNVEGTYKKAIQLVNTIADAGNTKVLAVDVPSGLSADTGEVLGTAVNASVTATFGYNKIGLTINDGPRLSGNVIVKDIGIYAPNILR